MATDQESGVPATRIVGPPIRARVVDFDISFDRILAIVFKTSVAVVLVSMAWSLLGFVAAIALAALGMSLQVPGQ